MKKSIDRLSVIADRAVASLGDFCGVLVLAMAFLIAVEVFMRYVIGRPPLLADELSRYILVAMTFLGMSYVWRERGHVRVEALVQRLSVKNANRLRVVTLALGLAFAVALFIGSISYIERSISQNRTSDSWMHVPLVWPESTILIGFLLLAIQVAVSVWRAVRTIETGGAVELETPQ